MEEKICYKCNTPKQLSNFVKNKRQKDGYHYVCKQCHKLYKENNKEAIKEKHQIWLNNNKEYTYNYNKQYNINNPEKKKQSIEKWFKNNPHYIKAWKKHKYYNDHKYKLIDNLRSRLYNAITCESKTHSILKLIGCPVDDLKINISSHFLHEMTWENHGKIWEIDHIKPCAAFDLTDIEQQKECFHYTNLQPLFKTTEIAESFGYTDQIGNRNKSKK